MAQLEIFPFSANLHLLAPVFQCATPPRPRNNAWTDPYADDLRALEEMRYRALPVDFRARNRPQRTLDNLAPMADELMQLLRDLASNNEEGEQIYPRTWNHDFIQLPVVHKDKQHRPTVTDADLTRILSNTKKQKYVVLFAILSGTGLRSQARGGWGTRPGTLETFIQS